MKRIMWAIGLAVVLVVGSTLPAAAAGGSAGGFHGGGARSGGSWHGGSAGWHGGGHGGTRVFIGGGFGWWGGPGWWGWPGWWGAPYPYYYSAQPVVIQQGPTEYIQQAPPPTAPQYWYYCQNAGAYYPYVKECPGGWMTVVPSPNPSAP